MGREIVAVLLGLLGLGLLVWMLVRSVVMGDWWTFGLAAGLVAAWFASALAGRYDPERRVARRVARQRRAERDAASVPVVDDTRVRLPKLPRDGR